MEEEGRAVKLSGEEIDNPQSACGSVRRIACLAPLVVVRIAVGNNENGDLVDTLAPPRHITHNAIFFIERNDLIDPFNLT